MLRGVVWRLAPIQTNNRQCAPCTPKPVAFTRAVVLLLLSVPAGAAVVGANDAAQASTNAPTAPPNAAETAPGVPVIGSDLASEAAALPPVPTLNAIAPANPVLPEEGPDRLGWIKKLTNRLLGRNDQETEPTIKVVVEGAPPLLAQNIKASLQRITVEEFRDFRDILPRLRTLSREAGQAVGYYEPQFRFVPLTNRRLRVEVVPGEPVKVHSQRIEMTGDGADDQAFRAIVNQPNLGVGDVFRHDQYEQTKQRLASLRSEHGYFDGRWVAHDVQVTLPDNTADIDLRYDSGARYRIGAVDFENITGPTDPLPVRRTLIDQLNPLVPGQPYDAAQIALLSRRLLDTRWFNNIEVRTTVPDPVQPQQAGTATARQAAGKAESILNQTDPDRLRPAVAGQVADGQSGAADSRKQAVPLLVPEGGEGVRAETTGAQDLPESLTAEQARQAEVRRTRQVPVTVVLDARYPNAAEAGLGYGTDTGVRVRGQYRRALLNDRGHSVESNVEVSRIRQALEVHYLMPYRHPLDDTLTFVGGYERESRVPTVDRQLDVLVQSVNIGAERALRPADGQGWARTWSLRYQLDQLDIGNLTGINPADLPSPFNVGQDIPRQQSLLAGFGVNRVKKSAGVDPLHATRQFYQVQIGSKALLTDVDLAILRAGVRRIYTFGADDRHQLVGRADLATILTSTFDDTPYNLRFFAGGDQSIRGYDYKSLSPLKNGYQVGGQNLAVGSIEYNRRVRPQLRGAVFVDAGNAFDAKWSAPVKVGVGAGVRWSSPIGPIRLDVAAGVSESSVPIRLHFFIGPPL